MIISRYLLKEILQALLAMTLILLLVFLSNRLVRCLSYAAMGKLAPNVLFQLMGFEIPYFLALLLPLGLFLGIIIAYGRLYADSEMTVLQACGFSVKELVVITGTFALVVTAGIFLLTLWINPLIATQKEQFIARIAADSVIDTLMAGRFQVSSDGKRVLYVEHLSRRKQASNIFVADQGKKIALDNNNPWAVVSAAFGSEMKEPVTHNHFVIATDGYRYEGIPGQNDFKIMHFDKYTVRMPQSTMISKHQEEEAVPTPVLWQNYQKPENAAELQWRISIPLSALLLGLLAIPLSQVQPRKGRYSQLLPAILIYVIYINMLFVGRNWVEQKYFFGLGMMSVHVFILLVALLFIGLQQNSFKFFVRKQ